MVRIAAVSSIKPHHDVLKCESCQHARKKPYIPYHLHCFCLFINLQLNPTQPSKGGPSEWMHPWLLHCFTARPWKMTSPSTSRTDEHPGKIHMGLAPLKNDGAGRSTFLLKMGPFSRVTSEKIRGSRWNDPSHIIRSPPQKKKLLVMDGYGIGVNLFYVLIIPMPIFRGGNSER